MNGTKQIRSLAAFFLFGLCYSPSVSRAALDSTLSRSAILQAMQTVNAWQYKATLGNNDRNWIRGTYYTGVMALFHASKDPRILDQAMKWADLNGWLPGTEIQGANKLTCGQTYMELYLLKKDTAMIGPLRRWVDSRQPNAPSSEGIWHLEGGRMYADALYVGPPTLAMLGTATGEAKYFTYLTKMYWQVHGEIFDAKLGLFYRDKRFITMVNRNGKKVIWSRGNGWVLAGIPRILAYLPKSDPDYAKFLALFKTMAAAVAPLQGADGLWRPNLADRDDFPGPETSGTAFFCAALAWGIAEGHLDSGRYLPVVEKAWRGLLRCVGPEGKLGYAQPVGDRPANAAPSSSAEYASGAFLLAGRAMLQVLETRDPTPTIRNRMRPGVLDRSLDRFDLTGRLREKLLRF